MQPRTILAFLVAVAAVGSTTSPAPAASSAQNPRAELGPAQADLPAPVTPSRRAARQQLEDLKMQVLNLAERQMELALRVLKRWIADTKK